MNAETSETIKARNLGFGMQILQLPGHRYRSRIYILHRMVNDESSIRNKKITPMIIQSGNYPQYYGKFLFILQFLENSRLQLFIFKMVLKETNFA